jgi:hypothetical protein
LKVLKIPAFGVLYKKIKIAQYQLHLTWKQVETRLGQINVIPKAPSDPQEISQVPTGYPTVTQ